MFGYGSLIWRPEFDFVERRPALVHGWHRALKMWSRINRGTPEQPGLVFGLLSGGSCRGMVFRVPRADGLETLGRLWLREMPTGVYDPRWLDCHTPGGPVRSLAFTLSRRSPNYTGVLDDEHYRSIFRQARGRYGSSIDYARQTLRNCSATASMTRPWRGSSDWPRPSCRQIPIAMPRRLRYTRSSRIDSNPTHQPSGVFMRPRLVSRLSLPAVVLAATGLLSACGSMGGMGMGRALVPPPPLHRPPRCRPTRPWAP